MLFISTTHSRTRSYRVDSEQEPRWAPNTHVATLEVGKAVGRAPRRLRHRLLREEARGGDHREAGVRELLLLHQGELDRVLGLEAERVEAEVAGRVVGLERRGRLQLLALLLERREANVDPRRLRRGDPAEHHGPQPHRQRRDLVDRGAAIAGEEWVKLLLHEEARGRKHAHAAVRQLALAVAVDL